METAFRLRVNTDTMPTVRCDERDWPLWFSVLGMGRWGDARGVDYATAIEQGWHGLALSEEELRLLLRIALEGGELRRRIYSTEEPRTVTDALIDEILALYGPVELAAALSEAWLRLPGPEAEAEPDPLARTASETPGPTSSASPSTSASSASSPGSDPESSTP